MKKVVLSIAIIALLACGLLVWHRSRPLTPVRTLHVKVLAIRPLFSPDGKTLAVLTAPNATGQPPYYDLELWDVATWQRKRILPRVKFFLAFSPDSKTLFAAEDSVQQWDVASGRLLHTYSHIGYLVNFSRDRRLLTTSEIRFGKKHDQILGSTLTIWDTVQRKVLHIITVPGSYVTYGDASFSQDEATLAVDCLNPEGRLTIWDMRTGKRIQTFIKGEQHSAFSRDGKMLATGGSSQKITLWNTKTWQPIRTIPTDFETVRDLGFSTSGTRLVASGDVATGKMNSRGQKELQDSLTLWDIPAGDIVLHLPNVFSARFSHDGRFLLTQGTGTTLWNAENGSQATTFGDRQTPIIYLALSPDDHSLATTDLKTDRVNIWPVPAH